MYSGARCIDKGQGADLFTSKLHELIGQVNVLTHVNASRHGGSYMNRSFEVTSFALASQLLLSPQCVKLSRQLATTHTVMWR